jgi:hypothetical protein
MSVDERQTASPRAQILAQRLAAANDELVALVEQLTDLQWRAVTAAEHWPIGVVADHVAHAYPSLGQTVATIAAGGLVETTWALLDEANARHAAAFGDRGKTETLSALRRNGAQLVALLRDLSDTQLAVSGQVPLLGEQPVSVDQVIERLVLPHTEVHLEHIRQTISGEAEKLEIA